MIANTRRSGFPLLVLLSLFFALLISGCGKSGSAGGGKDINDPRHPRTSTLNVLVPDPAGTTVYGNDFAAVDASNTSEGYVMVQYRGTSTKVKLQITTPDATVYSYSLSVGDYATFPLSGGSGSYHLDVLENAYDDLYAIVFSQDMDVTISDEFKPFLYPNQYVWFTPDSKAVAKTGELSDQSSSDLGYVQSVYEYVIKNISYDTKKAEDIPANYIPDIDETLSSGKGICFDYASLMSAMLRCQGIPTRLEVVPGRHTTPGSVCI